MLKSNVQCVLDSVMDLGDTRLLISGFRSKGIYDASKEISWKSHYLNSIGQVAIEQ